MAPGLERFRYLAKKMKMEQSAPAADATSGSIPFIKIAQTQLDQYMSEAAGVMVDDTDALTFWRGRRTPYSLLAPIDEDLLSAPASQAYVERLFSA